MSNTEDDYAAGMKDRRRVLGDAWVDRSLANRNTFSGEFPDLMTRFAFHELWGRPEPGDKARRMMVLCLLLGTRAYDEFAMHARAALDAPRDSGLSADEIREVLLMAGIYCGVPVANHAFGIVTGILRERGELPAHQRVPEPGGMQP